MSAASIRHLCIVLPLIVLAIACKKKAEAPAPGDKGYWRPMAGSERLFTGGWVDMAVNGVGDVFAVVNKEASRWNGSGWTLLPGLEANEKLVYIIGADDEHNLYVKGDGLYTMGMVVAKLDGKRAAAFGDTNNFILGRNIIFDKQRNCYAILLTNTPKGSFGQVMRFDGNNWNKAMDTFCNTMAYVVRDDDGNIYTGSYMGDIYKWDGRTATHIITGNDKGYNMCIKSHGKEVYVSGSSPAGGAVYRVSGNRLQQLGSAFNGDVTALATDPQGNLYATGTFKNDEGYHYVVQYDGKDWKELGKLCANDIISDIAADEDHVYATGHFYYNETNSLFIARYTK